MTEVLIGPLKLETDRQIQRSNNLLKQKPTSKHLHGTTRAEVEKPTLKLTTCQRLSIAESEKYKLQGYPLISDPVLLYILSGSLTRFLR